MPTTVHTTQTLVQVLPNLKRPSSALLDRYFPEAKTFSTEYVLVDVEKGRRTIAPLVSPNLPAPVRKRPPSETHAIKPAYVKEKTPFDPVDADVRAVGESVGGALSGQERENRALIRSLESGIRAVQRRLEVMAAEALRTGKLVLKGKDYPETTVDFQRNAALTLSALAGSNVWSNAASKPLRDIAAAQKLVRQHSGVNPVDVIMGDDAFTEFSEHAAIRDILDTRNITGNTLQAGQQVAEGLTFQGVVNRINIWTYSGWYIDPITDAEVEIWPAKHVAFASPGAEGLAGMRLFGMIKDPKANYAPMEFFPKIWEEEDPARTWLMVQSAPLVVPTRVDSTATQQVLA